MRLADDFIDYIVGSPEQARHYGKFLWQVAIDPVDVHWQDIDRLAQQLLVRRSMTGREVIAFVRDDPAAALLVAELLDRAGPAGVNDEPMPKLPDYRRFRIRRREDLVASAVGASLRTEGRVITEPYRPEEGIGRSPDWMLTLDGEPVALEVTRLLPPADVQKARHLMVRIETMARDLLAPIVARMDGQVLVNLAYSTYDVAGLGGARLTAAACQPTSAGKRRSGGPP